MSRPAKVTIIIPTFNRENYLRQCLESLLHQTLPPHQIVVVNDGSTDDTKGLLKPYLGQIQIIESRQLGKSGAINEGLKQTTGDYVWIFDDDDVALPDALSRFTKPLLDHPEYGYSFSSFFFTPTRKGSFELGRATGEYLIPDLEKDGPLIPLLENNYLGGAALFARTLCYKKVGPFDPALVRSQDYEMAIRIVRAFKGIRVIGAPTFHYRQHEGLRGSLRDRFNSSQQINKWLEYDQKIFRKFYRDLTLEEYLPPGMPLAHEKRRALLQRIEVMAIKLLFDEIIKDLHELEKVNGCQPFSEAEKAIIHKMADIPYYKKRLFMKNTGVIRAVKHLAKNSASVKMLQKELFRRVLKNLFTKPPRLSRLIKK